MQFWFNTEPLSVCTAQVQKALVTCLLPAMVLMGDVNLVVQEAWALLSLFTEAQRFLIYKSLAAVSDKPTRKPTNQAWPST